MIKLKYILLVLTAAFSFSGCSEEPAKHSFFAMDTYMNVTAYGEKAEDAVKRTQKLVESLEDLWSVTKADSEIGKINFSEGWSVDVSSQTARLIAFAKEMNDLTDGALDISVYPIVKEWGFTNGNYHVPDKERVTELLKYVDSKNITVKNNTVTIKNGMMIDLGAVAKGYAADLVVEQLKNEGVNSAVIDLGGTVRTVGTKPDKTKWVIGLRSPESDDLFGTVNVSECAMATSGAYERYFILDGKRYCHIIDPKTGYPADSGFISVTVISGEAKLCDALSTALFVLGADKASELRSKVGGFEYIAVTDSHDVLVTSGIFDDFELDPSYSDWKVTKVI